jgi:N-acyl-D-aspartate/D-glutamate deacylase
MTLPYAIRSLTSVGAQALGLRDRGLLREGMMADVVVLDLEQMGTDATYLEPCKAQRGVEWVVVNGKPGGVDRNNLVAVLSGRFLTRCLWGSTVRRIFFVSALRPQSQT